MPVSCKHNCSIEKQVLHTEIELNQEPWLKEYLGMNTKLTETKNYFEKDFFKLMNNAVFGKNN